MDIKFGTVIPKGYMLDITSWENDADDYKTTTFAGLSKETVNHFLAVLPMFGSIGRRGGKQLGNEDFRPYDTLRSLSEKVWSGEVTSEFIQKYFEFTPPSEEEFDEKVDGIVDSLEDEILDAIHCILGTPAQYDYDFVRVFESYTVRFFEEDLVLPEDKIVAQGMFEWANPSKKLFI